MPCFRTCLTCQSRSQAPLCLCTRRLMANQAEGTFGRLRYSLGGDRPSQTPHQPRSPERRFRRRVRTTVSSGWYFKAASPQAGA